MINNNKRPEFYLGETVSVMIDNLPHRGFITLIDGDEIVVSVDGTPYTFKKSEVFNFNLASFMEGKKGNN